VVDSLIFSYFYWHEKPNPLLKGKTLNSSDHHLGTSPLLLRMSYGM
jgi:hypothetical protein